ncbi:MAG: AAA family ATPase [Clostridiales bacterium]|nr:AAA family ATPase [Clostridiales bacterium]
MVEDSLAVLSDLLYKHYGKKVIILIDEYDAPLQKAYENNYYDDMFGLIRQMFGYVLKSNDSLFFSVLTGCMRISEESKEVQGFDGVNHCHREDKAVIHSGTSRYFYVRNRKFQGI